MLSRYPGCLPFFLASQAMLQTQINPRCALPPLHVSLPDVTTYTDCQTQGYILEGTRVQGIIWVVGMTSLALQWLRSAQLK